MLLKSLEVHATKAGIPAGKHCSNYATEVQALMQEASMIRDLLSDSTLSDMLSVLGGKNMKIYTSFLF